MPVPLAGAVLCGGRGRRMGRDKALIETSGEPLYARAARLLSEVADPVALARGDRALPGGAWDQIDDETAGAGPLAGLVAGLRWSPHELLAVVAADMPFVEAGVFTRMLEVWDGHDALVPVTKNGSQPLHAVYSRSALARLEARLQSDDLGLRSALEDLDVLFIEAGSVDRFALNVNTPDDLRLLDLGEG